MLGILGIGKMGYLLAKSLTDSKLYNKKDVFLGVRNSKKKMDLEHEGFKVTLDLNTLMLKSDTIIIAIKPQNLDEIIPFISKIDFKGKCVISIMASISIDYLKTVFKNAYIYRAMPNLAIEYKESNTTIAFDDIKYLNDVTKIFESLGKVYVVKEVEMNALTPINGSMVAFLAIFVRDFVNEVNKSGLGYEFLKRVTLESVSSASNLLLKSKDSIDDIINDVCSKGGVTIAGVSELYKNGFDDSIKACYEASFRRLKELTK